MNEYLQICDKLSLHLIDLFTCKSVNSKPVALLSNLATTFNTCITST